MRTFGNINLCTKLNVHSFDFLTVDSFWIFSLSHSLAHTHTYLHARAHVTCRSVSCAAQVVFRYLHNHNRYCRSWRYLGSSEHPAPDRTLSGICAWLNYSTSHHRQHLRYYWYCCRPLPSYSHNLLLQRPLDQHCPELHRCCLHFRSVHYSR